MSVRITSASAPTSDATIAESVSLSPKLRPSSSSTATVSFSFTIGMMPIESSSLNVLTTFVRLFSRAVTSAVSSTCATFLVVFAEKFVVDKHQLALADRRERLLFRGFVRAPCKPELADADADVAPDETSTIRRPLFCRSLSVRHRYSMRRRLSFPFS